ncbi:MAG: pyridoxal 5'-phosphate synthase glutaminase subunit PdxT [Chloroflexi bacterium]|nr:pyridoxal 5'-phosphate synthase glutaminase subunit PdxT [Chloroflexota bacterium]
MKIGVLALQGDFAEHLAMLRRLDVAATPVRLPAQLAGLDGLIIPGGESTTIGKLLVAYDLLAPIRQMVAAGQAVWGTCAGMILLAREAVDGIPDQPLLGVMDIVVRRNAFGRQVDSFEADLPVPALGEAPLHAVFIRAPLIEQVGPGVQVLARLPESGEGRIVAVRQGNLLATAFHPELTDDLRFHQYFLGVVAGSK